MKINKVILKDVRNFEDKVIDFSSSSVTALLGDNGSGKSTILKSIVHCLTAFNPIYGGALLDVADIRNGTEHFVMNLEVLFNSHETKQLFNREDSDTVEGEQLFTISLIRSESRHFLLTENQTTEQQFHLIRNKFISADFDGGHVLYFDPFRYLPNIELEGPNSFPSPSSVKENALASSIFPSSNMHNIRVNSKFLRIKQWLINLDFRRLKNPSEENEFIFTHVTHACNTLFAPYCFEKITDRGQILFKKGDNFIDIDKLSDGFKNIFIIIGEIFFRLYSSDIHNVKFFEKEAVILIDEIDCHLHPKWQTNLLPYLKEMFPNCQFIITTHSPFIVSSLKDHEIIKLEGI